ncbi:hypothetical protein BHE74_00010275, partial [Ensete ventricosum]
PYSVVKALINPPRRGLYAIPQLGGGVVLPSRSKEYLDVCSDMVIGSLFFDRWSSFSLISLSSICFSLLQAPKKDKAPPPSSKPAKSGGGKQKKKVTKWSKGKQKEKVNNAVLFDQANYDKMLSEVPKYKQITPSVLSERLRVWIPFSSGFSASLF